MVQKARDEDDVGRAMIDGKCLFAAPFDFIPDIEREYSAVIETEFREVWDESDLSVDERVTAWVTHPGYSFRITPELARRYFPNLEVLVTASTGSNYIAVEELRTAGVAFYCLLDDRDALERISASAEGAFLLLLNAMRGRGLTYAVNEIRNHRWRENEDEMRGHELQGKRVGIVGLGRIGRRLARYCRAFEAVVGYYDPYVTADLPRFATLEALFESSDVVVVACTLNDETEGMIGGDLLRLLHPEAVFVNGARAQIVDEVALADVLRANPKIRAGLDVLSGENDGTVHENPLIPFLETHQIAVTPHIAGATVESQSKAALIALSLIRQHHHRAHPGIAPITREETDAAPCQSDQRIT